MSRVNSPRKSYVLYMHLYMHFPCLVHTNVHGFYVLYKHLYMASICCTSTCTWLLCIVHALVHGFYVLYMHLYMRNVCAEHAFVHALEVSSACDQLGKRDTSSMMEIPTKWMKILLSKTVEAMVISLTKCSVT